MSLCGGPLIMKRILLAAASVLVLSFGGARDALADCPAAPLASTSDMVVSFLAANGTQAAPSTALTSSVKEGMLIYDNTADALKICNGTAWQTLAVGGSGVSAAGTVAGAVQFRSAGGNLAADDANLVWDDTNNRLGIGTATPGAPLDVNGNAFFSGTNPRLELYPAAPGAYFFERNGTSTTVSGVNIVLNATAGLTDIRSAGVTFMRVNTTSQLGIGTATPNASAIVDITSTTKGFLPPRMTTAQATGIASPTDGLIVYDMDTDTIKLRANGAWVDMMAGAGSETDPQVGTLTGTKWCAANAGGTAIDCTADAPATGAAGTGSEVQFRNSGTGAFAADPSLYWDNTNKYLFIDHTNWTGLVTRSFNAVSGVGAAPSLVLARGRGTVAAPTPPLLNDLLGLVAFRSYQETGGAEIRGYAAENQGTGLRGGYMGFLTTPVGTAIPLERVRIAADGNVGIGTGIPDQPLTVVGNGRFSGNITVGSLSGNYVTIGNSLVSVQGSMVADLTGTSGYGGISAFPTNGAGAALVFGGLFVGSSAGVKFTSAAPSATVDAGLSRLAANKLAVGNGTVGDITGTLVAGNVGIGTTGPLGRLGFSGAESATPTIRFQTGAATNLADSAISTYDDSGGTQLLLGSNLFYNASSALTRFDTTRSGSGIELGYTGPIQFYTGSGTALPTERVRIDGSGNVGIGTTSPASMLQVAGGIQLGDDVATCPGASNVKVGTLRYNSSNLQMCGSSGWNTVGSAGGSSFMQKGLSSSWAVTASTVMPFNTVTNSYGSNITSSGNQMTLKAGSSYMLVADVRGANLVNEAFDFQWYNVTASASIGNPGSESDGGSLESMAVAFIRPNVDTTVELRSAALAGSIDVLVSYSYVAAIELGGGSGGGGGGGTPGGATTQIQYNNAGAFAGSAGLVWDNTNTRLGVGIASPGVSVQAGRSYLSIKGVSEGGMLELVQAGADADNATVGGIQFSSDNNTNGTNGKRTAAIMGRQSGTTANDRGGNLEFWTKSDAGLLNQVMTISPAGNVGIGITTANSKLQVAGGIQLGDDVATCPGASNIKVGTLRYNTGTLQICGTGGWTNVASGGAGTAVSFNVSKTSAQSIVLGWQKVTWNIENFDTNNNFATDRFTPTVAGKYLLSTNVRSIGGTGNVTAVGIYKNGTLAHYGTNVDDSQPSASITAVFDANGTTDYFEVFIYSSISTTVYVADGAGSVFSGILIGGSGGGGGSSALSAITAATSTPTALANGTFSQAWNWALTGTTADAFTFGETTASTGGTPGDQSVLKATTLAASTATPLIVTNLGAGPSFEVNDETGDTDTTPFIIDASGNVGVGTAGPQSKLQVAGGIQLGDDAATCPGASNIKVGTLRYNTGTLQICGTGGWASVGSGGSTGPSFAVSKSANQTVSSSQWVKITWNTEIFDTNNNFASDRFTPTVAGKYIFVLNSTCAGGSTCYTTIRKNGAQDTQNQHAGTNGGVPSVIIYDMNGSTDYVEGFIWNEAGTTVVGPGYSHFSGSLLGGSGGGGGSSALSAITAATSTPTALANGTFSQAWNWALTGTTADAFTFGETTASTGGTPGDQSVLKATTLAASTATPLIVTNLGAGPSFEVNDETGDTDTTPFIIDASGNVGIGTTGPQSKLQVAGGIQLGDDTATCPGASNIKVGTLRYNTGTLQICGTGGWANVGSGGGASAATAAAWRAATFTPTINTWTDTPLTAGNTALANATHSTSTNPERITVTQSGTYMISYSLRQSYSGASTAYARLAVNGTPVSGTERSVSEDGSGFHGTMSATAVLSLSANDYVTVQVQRNSTSITFMDTMLALVSAGGGGGGGTPGGANTQVQFNDSGAFGGDADYTWNKTTNVLDVTGAVSPSKVAMKVVTGAAAPIAGSGGAISSVSTATYSTAGTFTYNPPVGARFIQVIVQGAGGGGGGADGQTGLYGTCGGGGGAGGWSKKTIMNPISAYTVTVGAGGTAGAAAAGTGGTGGTTSFVGGAINVSVPGGFGGVGDVGADSTSSAMGTGSVGTGGDINAGPPGTRDYTRIYGGTWVSLSGAYGMNSLFGSGGPYGGSAAGNPGVNPGSGGSGGCSLGATTANFAGGAGAPGLVYIEAFY